MIVMRIFLAFLLLCAGISAAEAKQQFIDIQVVESQSGVSAWLVEDHSVPVISIGFAFKGAGAAQDLESLQGVAQLASNTMDEGAGDILSKEFQKALQDLVITLAFSSSRDHFSGQLKTLSRNKERAFELLRLAINEPRFDAEPLERMREANQSRIRRSLSDPKWMAARVMNDKGFAGHPYARNSGGTLSSLAKITAEDLRAFVKTRLARGNLVVSAAGDITAAELGERLDQVFGALPESAQLKEVADHDIQNQGQVILYEQDIPQSIVKIMQPGIDKNDPDFQVAKVMNFILGSSGFGSRLMEEIREKRGLTYGIYSSFYQMDHLNALSVSTSTKNETVGEMLALIAQEWDRMKAAPVSAEELAAAKSYLIGSLPLSLTSTDKISGLLLALRTDDLPIDYLDQREEKIRATSVGDIQRLAKKLLNKDAFLTILVGKPEGVPEDIKVDQVIEKLNNVE